MKVGLDAHTLRTLNLDPLGLLDQTIAHGLEGVHFSSGPLLSRDADYRAQFIEKARAHNLYLELVGAGINPGRSGKSVAELVADWEPLFPLAVEVGSPILNCCFGLFRERMFTSPTFAEQLDLTTQVLRELSKRGADNNVIITVELHVDLTSLELRHLIETVDSPYVAVNLDTANALGLLEDPVEAFGLRGSLDLGGSGYADGLDARRHVAPFQNGGGRLQIRKPRVGARADVGRLDRHAFERPGRESDVERQGWHRLAEVHEVRRRHRH